MGFSCRLIKLCLLIIVSKYADAQERFDEHHSNYLADIPRKFVVKGEKARLEFKKYDNEIQSMANDKNLTAVYTVLVELQDVKNKLNMKKKMFMKSKKYNVPLKKQSMKLSNFEVLLRKLAQDSSPTLLGYDRTKEVTTAAPISEFHMPMKPLVLKYKPIIRRVKTNYTKIIKPVRTKIITIPQ